MTTPKLKPNPVHLGAAGKRNVRTQFGALCYRVHDGKLQVLVITSRGTGSWIIPKGWPIHGKTPSDAAATEAFEEAGAQGKISDAVLGVYSYMKARPDNDSLSCMVTVFALRVTKLLKDFPEAGQRKRKWLSREKAAAMVANPELGQLILNFDPKRI